MQRFEFEVYGSFASTPLLHVRGERSYHPSYGITVNGQPFDLSMNLLAAWLELCFVGEL